jgi:glycosyltransferase involved in cell wall biosynthesis
MNAGVKRAKIGLCMIVKNEAEVIERCLKSVMPMIDTWTIVDTGSTDRTCEIINNTVGAMPGRLHGRPWVDFAHNRSEAIELAKHNCDYLFIIDADEILTIPKAFDFPSLKAAAYSATIVHGNLRYARTCLISTQLAWRYVGVLHEYLACDQAYKVEPISGLNVLYTAEGARSKNPRKYHDDAAVLAAGLVKEPQNLRYMFYLAQSWRDANEPEKALQAYAHRTTFKGWDEEDWFAKYQVARLMDRTGKPESETINAYLLAHEARPSRAEAPMWLGTYLHRRGRWANAKAMFTIASKIPMTTDRLFVENDCYLWRRYDELALSFFYQNGKNEARQIWEALLKNDRIPKEHMDRIHANIKFCIA